MKLIINGKTHESGALTIGLHKKYMEIWNDIHENGYDIFVNPYPEGIIEKIVDLNVYYFGKSFSKKEALENLGIDEIISSMMSIQNEVIEKFNKMVEGNFTKGTDSVPEK